MWVRGRAGPHVDLQQEAVCILLLIRNRSRPPLTQPKSDVLQGTLDLMVPKTLDTMAALHEVHTRSGRHELHIVAYPRWVPPEVREAARRLTEADATRMPGDWATRTFSIRLLLSTSYYLQWTAISSILGLTLTS